jgi:hypothetical protein
MLKAGGDLLGFTCRTLFLSGIGSSVDDETRSGSAAAVNGLIRAATTVYDAHRTCYRSVLLSERKQCTAVVH